ncbi:MAG TPA: NAD-dependent epimerase/dehydratase family protein [Edaphocola sp.]|nr:NAD-dependent epimerase/dehydratase family protein [Edaphocola sp.]
MILVTGASGFLGLHLLEVLVQQSLPVRALFYSFKPDWSHPLVEWVQCDLLDVYAVQDVMKDIQYVYHCAAIVSFDKKDKERIIVQNRVGTANLVDEALNAGVKKLLFVSSIAALGRAKTQGARVDEETHWEESKNNTAYAISKYQSEMEVWRAYAEGLPMVIVNPGIILGEGDFEKGSAHLFQTIYDGLNWFTEGVNGWVDVKDVVRIMLQLMDSEVEGERFVLVEGNHSYKYIFEQMALSLGKKPATKKASPFMGTILWRFMAVKNLFTKKKSSITKETARTAQSKYYYSNDKILKTLAGFSFCPIQETIKRVSANFLKNK